MNCERLETLLLDLLYEELEETSAREARAHAHGCASCGRKLESFRQVRRVALSLPEPAPPALPYTALLAEAQNAARQWKGEKEGEKESVPQKPAKRRKDEENTSSWWDSFSQKLRFLLSPPFAAAAALTLLLASSFYLVNSQSASTQSAPGMMQNAEAPALKAAAPAPATQAAMEEGERYDDGAFERQEEDVLEVAMAKDSARAGTSPALPPAEPTKEPSDAPLIVADAGPKPAASRLEEKVAPSKKAGGKSSLDLENAYAQNRPGTANTSDPLYSISGLEAPRAPLPPPAPPAQSTPPTGAGGGYGKAITEGDKAYKGGQYEEAARAYEEARDAAVPGSADFTSAAEAQVRAEISSGDCAGAESAARLLTSGTEAYAAAIFSVADCYQQKGSLEKALLLYQEISSSGYTVSTEARRRATTLETKLSKPSLSGNEEPAKTRTKKAPAKKSGSSDSEKKK